MGETGSISIPLLFGIVTGAFGGMAGVLAFMKKRDDDLEKKITGSFEKREEALRGELDRLKQRVAVLENGAIEALASAFEAQAAITLLEDSEMRSKALEAIGTVISALRHL